MRVDALQVADDIEVDGARLDAFGAALAQAGEMTIRGFELAAAHVRLGEQKTPSQRHVAAGEDVEGEAHVVHHLTMETLQLGRAFGREGVALLDLLAGKFHQVFVDDVADVLEVGGEGQNLDVAAAVGLAPIV
jgi:hypothetical protein